MKRDELRGVNLTDLQRRYRPTGSPVAEAAVFLKENLPNAPHLKRVLRDHRQEAIYSAIEIRHRDSVDALLSYYSLLELASLVRFVPTPLPQRLAGEIKRTLGTDAVRAYYGEYYPLQLPQSLYLRITGRHRLAERKTTIGATAYLEFLSLANEFDGDENIGHLMAFMDDYVIKGYSWVDLKALLIDPKSYAEEMCIEPDEQTVLHSAMHGFRKLIEFSENFDRFLQGLEDIPLFQSGAWHYFSYWFEHLEDRIGPVLESALANAFGAAGDIMDEESLAAIEKAARLQREQLRRLFDSPYRGKLPEAVERALSRQARKRRET